MLAAQQNDNSGDVHSNVLRFKGRNRAGMWWNRNNEASSSILQQITEASLLQNRICLLPDITTTGQSSLAE